MKATVVVRLKSEVLDPQGQAIGRAAASLGYDSVGLVRQGKFFEIELDADDPARAAVLVEELSKKLLSNPVIEDFEVLGVEADPN